MEDSVKKLVQEFIVNVLGINLCSVGSITVNRIDDGQLDNIHIDFIPNTEE